MKTWRSRTVKSPPSLGPRARRGKSQRRLRDVIRRLARGGRHIRYANPTPLANLHLTLLDKVGVRLDSFADSRGKMDELFEPLSM